MDQLFKLQTILNTHNILYCSKVGENKISLSAFLDKIDILLSSIPNGFKPLCHKHSPRYAKSFWVLFLKL